MNRLILALLCATATLVVVPASTLAEASAEATRARAALRKGTQSLDRAMKAIPAKLRALETRRGTPPTAAARRAAIGAVRGALTKSQAVEAAFKRAAAVLGARAAPANAGVAQSESLQTALSTLIKDLEAQDKMGNFEIQDLMSRLTQARQLADAVEKQEAETAKSIIGNMR